MAIKVTRIGLGEFSIHSSTSQRHTRVFVSKTTRLQDTFAQLSQIELTFEEMGQALAILGTREHEFAANSLGVAYLSQYQPA